MFWGLGSGFAHNKWPGNSDGVLSGGSPRYNIYKTSDGSYVAAAPLEDRFWNKFCEAIELPKKFIKIQNDQEKVIQEIRKIIGQKEKKYWLDVNDTFVMYGQNICKPISPMCEVCKIRNGCKYYKTNSAS